MPDFTNINKGATPNDGTGDTLRAGADIINNNNALLPVGDKNVSTTQKIYSLSDSLLTGIVDDTYFDLMSFDAAATPNTSSYGITTGELVISILSRNTAGNYAMQHVYYRISTGITPTVLESELTIVGTDNASSPTSITATLQEKAGATSTNLTLQFKFTHTGFDAAVARIYATFNGQALATTETRLVVPTFLI